MATTAPLVEVASQPRFAKVSSAGLILPFSATDWVAVYDSVQQLTFTRHRLPGGERNWSGAKSAAQKLDLCGFTDWRLGELQEWQRAFDYTRADFALDPAFFTIADDEYWTWTGMKYARASGDAWLVLLRSGGCDWSDQGDRAHVRAVRAGQLSWPSVSEAA